MFYALYSYDTDAFIPFIRHEPFAYHSSKITEPALINAATTSFGSICLGGLFIAIVQFSSFALRNTAKVRSCSDELSHLGTFIVHILTTRSILCYACRLVETEGSLLPSLCAPCHILRSCPRSSRELQQLHPHICWHHRGEPVCSSAVCQQNLPQELALGPYFRYVYADPPLAIVCSSRLVSFVYSTDPWLFCFAHGILLDFLTKLILFIYSTLFSLLTGFAAYIFATHHLHSPYGYVIGILSSIIPYYITGFFTHIMAITYGTKSFLLCITRLFCLFAKPMNTRLTFFFLLMATFAFFFRVDATFLCYAIDLDTNTCHSNKAHSAFGSSF